MTITKHSEVFAINGLTETELNIMLAVVHTADRRCFEEQDEDGNWYSNDDFVLRLDDEQRTALRKLGEKIELIYNS